MRTAPATRTEAQSVIPGMLAWRGARRARRIACCLGLLLQACASSSPSEPTPAPESSDGHAVIAEASAAAAASAVESDAVALQDAPELVAASAVVERLHVAMTEILRAAEELGYQGRYARMQTIVRESYDLVSMARWTLGPETWQKLSSEQRRTWLETFERFHISSVAEVRDRDRGQAYRLLGARQDGQGRVLVSTVLDLPGRNVDLYTDYLLRQVGDDWLIVDIFEPPSVSRVAMRRAEYATVLERGGFELVLETMRARIEQRAAR